MKIIKVTFIITACSCLCLLSACSTFNDLLSGIGLTSQNAGATEVTGTDNLADFNNDSETLPGRPANEWIPVAGLKFPTIYFAFDQYRVGTSQMNALDDVAHYMNKNQDLGLIIEGYCDEKGSAEYNIGLGERRALSVYNYLEKLGVPVTRLQTISYGSERPVAPGHNQAAWSKNRRAELIPAKM